MARMIAPIVATRCFRNRRQKSCDGERCSTDTGLTAWGFCAAGSMSTQANARITPRKEEVRDEVPYHEQSRGHHDARDDEICVLREKRFHSESPQARPGHDVFD